MSDKDMWDEDLRAGEETQAKLERKFVEEYLQGKGYRLEDLAHLPEAAAKQLMREACQFASLRLADFESKVRFRKKIHYESG